MIAALGVGRRVSTLAVFVFACTPKHAPSVKPTPSATAPSALTSVTPPVAASATPSCTSEAHPVLTVAAVTAFAERWRQIQRNRDFSGYSALYAAHFSGLLWDDASFSRLDRAAWLRAHQNALTLDSVLATARVVVAVGAGGAQIRFAASAKDASLLPELFVIATSDGLQIAREAPSRPRASALTNEPGLWLADERFAILSTRPEASWLEGSATFDGNGTALSNVTLTKLPKALRDWLGRPVRVLGATGTVCETRLQRFAIRSQITPDLATAERWDGCADEAISPAEIAREIVQLTAEEGRTLVAEFATPCKGAIFASDPNLPAPTLAAPEPASAELGELALSELRKLPSYGVEQARFRREHPDAEGAWDDHDARRSVWSLALSGTRLVVASVAAGAGCSGFSGSVSAVWQRNGGALSLRSELHARDEKRISPRVLLDLGDGKPSLLLGPDGDYRANAWLSGKNEGERLLTSTPFFAGPC